MLWATPWAVSYTHLAGTDALVYVIASSGAELRDGDRTKLRLLNENKNKAEVWLLKDGSWEHAEADERGKYIRCV